ncbi:Eukaryotic translation initiation factor 3 subunit C [Thelohanellus kitauei]|uniref:Eukaryotic translation initiation factor 3 subunit C n=1 Tax=Thelohanellus kitauei TaxID=669202 RepID=A0A0C2MEJ7_THEKT|nr:Eukaryotic translation initiation factor 3 subunit C [Thelohanellus kitauei]
MSFTSKFFGSTSSSESEQETDVEKAVTKKKPIKTYIESSEDEDAVKRVIKSAQQKKRDEYTTIIKKLKNSLKIKDFDSVLTEFDQLHKAISKYSDLELPSPVVKALYETEELVKTSWDDKELKGKLTKLKLKALTTLKQKVKKSDLAYQEIITKCRGAPDDFESDWKESDNEDAGANQANEFIVKKTVRQTGAQEFLKSEKSKEAVHKRERKINAARKKSDDEGVIIKPGRQAKDLFSSLDVIDSESVHQKINELYSHRGKKVSDKAILNSFLNLRNVAMVHDISPGVRIKLYMVVLSLQLELYSHDYVMKYDHWNELRDNFEKLLKLVSSTDNVKFKQKTTDEEEKLMEPPYVINGSFVNHIFKIWDELNNIMIHTDAYSLDYISRMNDVVVFSDLVTQLQNYVEENGSVSQICDIYMLRIEQIYYKLDLEWLLFLKKQLAEDTKPDSETETQERRILSDSTLSQTIINNLSLYIYKNGSERLRYLALLCQVYHHAIHDRLTEARALFLRSSVHTKINSLDNQIRVYYNRALAQLGLCYFRKGKYMDSLNVLKDITTSGVTRELLAQSLPKGSERIHKKEGIDRQLILPFHVHVNLELLECAFMVSLLILETPISLTTCKDIKDNFNSRGLVSLVRNFEKTPLIGPPELLKESVYASYKALCSGDWKTSLTNILRIRPLKLLVNYDSVVNILSFELKKSCLMAYLFTNCGIFVNMKISSLVTRFELEEKDVILTVNKMIVVYKFPARWDENFRCLIFYHQALPNSISTLSNSFSEKLSMLLEHKQRYDEITSNLLIIKEKAGGFPVMS